MDSDRLALLFYRYINNTCTDAEKAEFLDAVNDPRHEPHLKELMDRLLDGVSGKKMPAGRAERILAAIFQKDDSVIPFRARTFIPWGKIAASFLLVVALGGVAFYYSVSNSRVRDAHTAVSPGVSAPDYIALPDGSTVILNAGSHLDYPETFIGEAREVSLTGEGYFDIAHDAEHPFVVHTGKLKTTVLGTAFNIKAYPDQSDITVTVRRGKVKVSDDKKVLGIINPDQQITFNRTHEFAEQKVVDSHSVTAWMEKDIFFDDVTIGQALEQLERRFGISVKLENQIISECRFTATFVRGEDIDQILRILCDFNNAQLIDKGDEGFVIEGGECPL